ncbi:AbfB domain-containing protein [Aquabacterium sp. A7-Y]|uniref:AbfB domain-containing protein n=1 Tax=Aquabacterium sp. A7-Y TaxID=1349605 RepID=UPI00223E7D2D|nr:AbfB domain-containing protein [Aquabacterium sp. A7-Y]MCW7541871.1 AbfB domain-containing protein [Aquabacterium sp. A7-Y]
MRATLLCFTLPALVLTASLPVAASADTAEYAQTVSFESVNFPGRYIRHSFFLGVLTPISSGLDKADATFIRRPGLSGLQNTVSFESINIPGHFLRHQNLRLKLQRNDGSDLFRRDASFFYRPGLSWEYPYAVSLESANVPGHFIRHQNFELWLVRSESTARFANDASFYPRSGLWPDIQQLNQEQLLGQQPTLPQPQGGTQVLDR